MSEIENYKLMFDQNIKRVESLCELYNQVKSSNIKEKEDNKFTDILRSAVVLLHASFEEYYRNVLKYIFPKICTQESLKNISFVGSEGNHKEKISLCELLQHRDKTVDKLINESIQECIDLKSFNNYRNIADWSIKIGINLSAFSNKGSVEKMIQRRHQIVHQADRTNDKLNGININTVESWNKNVCELVEIINEESKKYISD